MAITILTSPQKYVPVDNEIRYVVNSNNKAQCNFEYVADVFVNGATSSAVRIKLSPNGATASGFGEFYFQDFLKSYTSYDMDMSLVGLTGLSRVPNSISSYRIAFGESYDGTTGCTGSATVYPALTTGATGYAFAGGVGYVDWPSYDWTKFKMLGVTGSFLTNSPAVQWTHPGEQAYLDFLCPTGTQLNYLIVEMFPTGLTYSIFNADAGVTGNAPYDQRRLRFGVGPENLLNNGIPLTPDVTHYECYMSNSTVAVPVLSETKTYNYGTASTNYDYVQFIFQGQLGGMETKTFRLRSTMKTQVDRKMYEKLMRNWSLGDRGRQIFDVKAVDSFTVTSEALTNEEAMWLRELIISPEVYVASVNPMSCGATCAAGYKPILEPIIITDNSWTRMSTNDPERVNFMTVSYQKAYDNI